MTKFKREKKAEEENMTILLNVKLDKSVLESLFLNKQYTAADGSTRKQGFG